MEDLLVWSTRRLGAALAQAWSTAPNSREKNV